MPKIKRNATNSHFRSTYITWDDLADAVIPRLQECGLYFEQEEGEVDGYVTVSTRITHAASGEYKQYAPYRIKETTSGNQDHNAGKSTTYAQKRSLILALGLRGTDEDTDGNDLEPRTRESAQRSPLSNALEVENRAGGQRTSLNNKHTCLDLTTERKKFFAIADRRGLTDSMQRCLAYYHFGKSSRSELTAEEFRDLAEIFKTEDNDRILRMLHKVKAMREAG